MMAMYYLNPSPVRFLGFDNFLRSTSTQSTVKIQNSVKFSEACRVVLIPKREEYAAAGIQLWWSPNEFHKFKKVSCCFVVDDLFLTCILHV